MNWQLTKSSAMGNVGPGHVEVFPTTPGQAARLQIGPEQQNPWEFAAVRPIPQHAEAIEEIYSRQHDLICRYRQSAADSFAFQLDWQLLPASGPFALGTELWLSVQTALLDTQPALEVSCRSLDWGVQDRQNEEKDWPAWRVLAHRDVSDEPLAGDPATRGPAAMVCMGQSRGDLKLSGLWMIEPTDQCHARICTTTSSATSSGMTRNDPEFGDTALSVRLFGHFMEKGVIRRGRMRFLLADRPISDADIAEAYREFSTSPLPLTA